ncbi:Homeobox-like_domain superfamily [Hexamita inflata]|uniref:Homeobox-like domain superfamily n=1 Tax=Hexamita inflata TaxID=28002 RepID=A0AA86R235_9EUKA|nr:Homeobox-like domain superfamily [Hexamita inflata]
MRGTYNTITNQQRMQIVQEVFCNKISRIQIAEQMNLKYSTVKHICQQYEKYKIVELKARGGPGKQKSNPIIIKFIIDLRNNEDKYSYTMIKQKIFDQFNINLCPSDIRYLYDRYYKNKQENPNNDVATQCNMNQFDLYITAATQWDESDPGLCDVGFETK